MSACRIGWEDIKSGYKMFSACPFYALYDSNGRGKPGRLCFSYKGDDRNGEGWQLLEENLKVAEQTTPSTEYCIMFYDQLGKRDNLDSSTPYAGSFNLKMKAYDGAVGRVGNVAAADNSFLAYLQTELRLEKEKNADLHDQVRELEEELEELQAADKKPAIEGVIGQIGEAGNAFPWLADLIKDWSTVFKHKVMAPAQQRPAHAGSGIAGVASDAPPDQRVNHAIKTMVAWYQKEYGGQGEGADMRGFIKFADDMQLLANLTKDDDIMHLALKKLRQLEN